MVQSTLRARWAGGRRSASSSRLWYIMFRLRLLPLILAISLGTTACKFQKRPPARVFVPPLRVTKATVAIAQPELPPPPEIDIEIEPPLLEVPTNLPNATAP